MSMPLKCADLTYATPSDIMQINIFLIMKRTHDKVRRFMSAFNRIDALYFVLFDETAMLDKESAQ